MEPTTTTSGILRTLLWLLWLWQFDTIPGNGHWVSLAFWEIFKACWMVDSWSYLFVVFTSSSSSNFLALPRKCKHMEPPDPCRQRLTFFVCQWFRKWSLLHVSGSIKQPLKTLKVYDPQHIHLWGQPLQNCHGDCLVLTLSVFWK